LSDALDTNGQNARYARASRRWGKDPDILKALVLGSTDPAGVVARFQVAANKLGGLRIRAAHKQPYEYMQYPADMFWLPHKAAIKPPPGAEVVTDADVRKLALEADVIHLNNSERAYVRFQMRKPALLHHHGTLFRGNPQRMLDIAKQFRMVQAVSTIDLMKAAPDVLHWLPSAYDVDELLRYGQDHARKPDGMVRIVQAPTQRTKDHDGKATGPLMQAVKELQDEGLPVELVLVENQTWHKCLSEKSKADIVFDQLAYGYGCNGIEAWALGKPVIAGADPETLRLMDKQWNRKRPFLTATEKTLKTVLRKMVKSADMRAEWSERGLAHVRKYHDEKPALAKLAELYTLAISGYASRRIPMKGAAPVTFVNPRRKRLWLEGQPIPFPDGTLRTVDPFVIQFVRKIIHVHPLWGIEEVA